MGKWANDLVMDGALDIIKNNVIGMSACSAQPANYTEASATYKLAAVVMVSGDFTHANGDVSGRKTQVAQKTGVTVDSNGTADHVALYSGSVLYYVTTATPQAVTAGNTMAFPQWDAEFRDPTA